MPRIARPISDEAQRLRIALALHIERRGQSANALAKELGIPQSTLCRFLQGRTKSVSPRLRMLVHSLHNFSIPRIGPGGKTDDNARLAVAAARASARNPKLAGLLATLIDAIVDADGRDVMNAR